MSGYFFGSGFLIFTLIKYRKAPEFINVATIILSCAGVVLGVHLLYVATTISISDLGKLANHRVPIVLGALAVIWISTESTIKTCRQSIEAILDKKRKG